jgi:DtxR family transcriptional regulator, Mn-dependent transcriptional regulator
MATAPRRRDREGAGHRTPPRGALTETLEDYLEIVFMLSRRHAEVRVRDIARAKSVRMPTVVIALRRLAERGLIQYAAGEFARLTAGGMALGRDLARRHVFLQRFLEDVLGVPERIAARDACGLEHHLTPVTLARLSALIAHIDACRAGAPVTRGGCAPGEGGPSAPLRQRAWSRRLGDATPR